MVSRSTEVVAKFDDKYGDEQTLIRTKGTLRVKRKGITPVLCLNRAAAKLVGQKIKTARTAAGLSMEELGKKMGIGACNKNRVWNWEDGEINGGPKLGTLYAIALALEIPVAALLPSAEEVSGLSGVRLTSASVEKVWTLSEMSRFPVKRE